MWASIDPLGEDVVAHATRVESDDPLRFWFTARAAGSSAVYNRVCTGSL